MVKIDYELCIQCYICVDECPMGCFQILNDYPHFSSSSESSCLNCGLCIQNCPTLAIDWKDSVM